MATSDAIDVLILAGGLGTRLRPVVADRPKALAEVSGRPFLEHQFAWLKGCGLRRVVLALGHLSAAVEAYVADAAPPGLEIVCSVEDTPLGTGGAIRRALPRLTTETVLVLNGDSLVEVNLAAFAAFHAAHPDDASLVLARSEDTRRFGRVACDDDGRILSFGEKSGAPGPGWINAGVYLLPRRLIAAWPEKAFSLETDVFAAAPPPLLYGFPGGDFIDIGTPEAYARASAFADRFRKAAS